MRKLTSVATMLVLALVTPMALGSISVNLIDTTNPGQPRDSGWTAVLADNIHNGIIVDAVGADYVVIEIAKDFYTSPTNGDFTPNVIQFTQRLADGQTMPKILINDESIWNITGQAWTDYHWWLTGSVAAFDKAATDASGFSVEPFTKKTWSAAPVGWAATYSSELAVTGGTVADGDFFNPGLTSGYLAIQADLSNQQAVSFTLYQAPMPEPATIALLLSGAGLLVGRRRS